MDEIAIRIRDLHHTYLRGTPLETVALQGAHLEVRRGEAVGIIGRAGAGKSTLVQYCNGLLRPRQPGAVWVLGQDTGDPRLDIRQLRQQVGLAFQRPEQQLFSRLVGDDIAFGPRQIGLSWPQARHRVQAAMAMVGLDFEAFVNRFTFSLSGGERRKVALAGILAMQPQVLILDESTAGLDPRSRQDLLDQVGRLHREEGLTLIVVTSWMEILPGLVDRIYVLDAGRVVMEGAIWDVFARGENLRRYGLDVPPLGQIVHQLSQRGYDVDRTALTVAEAEQTIWKILSSSGI